MKYSPAQFRNYTEWQRVFEKIQQTKFVVRNISWALKQSLEIYSKSFQENKITQAVVNQKGRQKTQLKWAENPQGAQLQFQDRKMLLDKINSKIIPKQEQTWDKSIMLQLQKSINVKVQTQQENQSLKSPEKSQQPAKQEKKEIEYAQIPDFGIRQLQIYNKYSNLINRKVKEFPKVSVKIKNPRQLKALAL